MESSPNPARKVGIFVLVGLVLTALLLVNFSKGVTLLNPRYSVTVKSENVGGLKPGASVVMSGVPIGHVEEMELGPDGKSVLILCRIHRKFTIYGDAIFEIEQSGFLGDQYVSIVPTANLGRPLADGTTVQARKPFNLQEAARSAVGLMQRLDSAAGKIDLAVDRVDKLLLSEQTLTNFSATVANFRRVSERADSSLGRVEDLVRTNTPLVGNTLSNLNAFSTRLSDMSDRVSRVVTNVDTVIDSNKAELQAAMKNLQDATGDLRSITTDLQAGKGLAGGLLKDEQVHAQFNEIVGNLTVLSSNLSHYGLLYKPKAVKSLTNESRYTGRNPFR